VADVHVLELDWGLPEDRRTGGWGRSDMAGPRSVFRAIAVQDVPLLIRLQVAAGSVEEHAIPALRRLAKPAPTHASLSPHDLSAPNSRLSPAERQALLGVLADQPLALAAPALLIGPAGGDALETPQRSAYANPGQAVAGPLRR